MSFVYGVETSSAMVSYSFVDGLEGLILDVVAASVLRCVYGGAASSGGGNSTQRSKLRRIGGDAKIVRVRYAPAPHATTTCDPLSPQAEGCAVLTTHLLVTTAGGAVPVPKMHNVILTVIVDAFSENIFAEFIPELLSTSYLGPDPGALTFSNKQTTLEERQKTHAGVGTRGFSSTAVIFLSLGSVLLLLKVIVCVRFPTMMQHVVLVKNVFDCTRKACLNLLPIRTALSGESVGLSGECINGTLSLQEVHTSARKSTRQ